MIQNQKNKLFSFQVFSDVSFQSSDMLILHNLFFVYLNKRSAQTQHPFLATLMGLIFVGINFADFEDWVLSAKIGPNEKFERSYPRNFE